MQIIVENLTKTYRKRKEQLKIIDHFSYTFKSGKMYVIKGGSGRGKTTLLSMLALLQPADEGAIYYDDLLVSQLSNQEQCRIRRNEIGIVFQDFNLFHNLDILDNVMLVDQCMKTKDKNSLYNHAIQLLDEFGLKQRIHHRPGELSGGEQQRVGLIRAILNQPEILICDEPISNLDAENREKIVKYINEYVHTQGKIVIVTSHDASFDEFADALIML